jgi:glycosyltransferase involved in cell wall biosynthesis
MDEIEFSIIIPAYNEEKRILKTLDSYIRHLSGSEERHEIIVVTNGCKDRTVSVVQELANTTKGLRLYDFEASLGKGGAIREGLARAQGRILGFLDADEAVSMEEALLLMDLLRRDPSVDCIIGSKWKDQGFRQVSEPFLRKVLSRGWNLLVRGLLGLDFRDTQAGAKFMRRETYRRMNQTFLCSGFEFDVELLVKLKRQGARIVESYIQTEHVIGSTFKYRHMMRMLLGLASIWWHYRGVPGKGSMA